MVKTTLPILHKGFKTIGFSFTCPACGSGNTYFSCYEGAWVCFLCGEIFPTPELEDNMREFPETHQQGTMSMENIPEAIKQGGALMDCDFGVQIARDGRVWICVDGVAFIRFLPKVPEIQKPEVKEEKGVVVDTPTVTTSMIDSLRARLKGG